MGDYMIQIEHLHKTYRSGFLMKPKLALKDVSFNVESGQVYGFIGPNGAGKSTTIKVLTGLLNFDSGKVLVNGISPRDVKSRRFIGYSPEQPYFYDYLTGRELLKFYGRLVGLEGSLLDSRPLSCVPLCFLLPANRAILAITMNRRIRFLALKKLTRQ